MEKQKNTVELLKKVENLFIKKGWKLENENEREKYNRFCEMLSVLNKKEQNLILELTEDFIEINLNNYILEIKRLFNDNIFKRCTNVKQLYIYPLLSLKERRESVVKSSSFMIYLLKSREIDYNSDFKDIKINLIDNFYEIKKSFNEDNSKKIVLLDDYIGSGETAISAVNCILNTNISYDFNRKLKVHLENEIDKKYINPNKVIIASLVAQQNGINKVKEETGIDVLTNYIIKKGISDKYTESIEKQEKIKLMESIGDKIKVKEDERFGYKNSEALVSLVRTPNNTFPIFRKIGRNILPPFPRRF